MKAWICQRLKDLTASYNQLKTLTGLATLSGFYYATA
jgi:hypothetical protein